MRDKKSFFRRYWRRDELWPHRLTEAGKDWFEPNDVGIGLNVNHQRLAIRFSLSMAEDVVVERWSMSWHEEKGRLDYACRWLDEKTLAVDFSREVYPGESIFLILRVADKDGWNTERVVLEYPPTAQ